MGNDIAHIVRECKNLVEYVSSVTIIYFFCIIFPKVLNIQIILIAPNIDTGYSHNILTDNILAIKDRELKLTGAWIAWY